MLWYSCLIKHTKTVLWTKDCCTYSLLHAQQDALTQYKEIALLCLIIHQMSEHTLKWILMYICKIVSHGSVVGIVNGYGPDDWGVGDQVLVGSRAALESTQPPIQWIPRVHPLGVKRQECEADRSAPTSAKVKIYTPTPPHVFMAQCLISLAQGQLCHFYT
jgi:hypothetical protein